MNGFGFEEMNECQEASFEKAFERAGSYIIKGAKVQPPPIVVGTCNPSQGWIKRRIYDPWKNGTLQANWKYIPSKITDNPHLPQAYIDSLTQNMTSFSYRIYVEGDWDVMVKSGYEFYKCFEYDRSVRDYDYDPDLPLHLTFDFNVRPAMHATVWQICDKIIWQLSEIVLKSPNNKTESVCRHFARLYHNHQSGLFVYGDPSGKNEDTRSEKGFNDYTIIRKELQRYSPTLRVAASHPNPKKRGDFINLIFEKGYNGIDIYINPECKATIEDISLVKEKADGSKLKEKDKDGNEKYGHLSDSLDYLIVEAFKSDYTSYQRAGETKVPYVVGKTIQKRTY